MDFTKLFKGKDEKGEKKNDGFKDKKKEDKPKNKGPFYRKLTREHNVQLMPTMNKEEDTVLNINVDKISLGDASSVNSMGSGQDKKKLTALGKLKKRIADKYHKYIPHKVKKDLILDQHLVKQDENKPEFAILFLLVFLTFWCGFICQTVALMLCVLGHTAAEEGDYYRARIHQKCAFFFIILGLVLGGLILFPLNQPYEPPFKMGVDSNKTWFCDPGCFFQKNRNKCYC